MHTPSASARRSRVSTQQQFVDPTAPDEMRAAHIAFAIASVVLAFLVGSASMVVAFLICILIGALV